MSTEPTNKAEESQTATEAVTKETPAAEATDKVEAEPKTTETKKSGSQFKIILFIIVLIIAGAVGFKVYQSNNGGPAVASVNGDKITENAYQGTVSALTDEMAAMGFDTSNEAAIAEIETEALDRLINTKLLVQAAEEAGHTATDEEVDAMIADITTQFGGEEAFTAYLTDNEISQDTLREDMYEQIVVETYLTENTEITAVTATEEEVQALYDDIAANAPEGQEVPTLEEVYAQVESQVVGTKQQEMLGDLLAELRAEAEITTY